MAYMLSCMLLKCLPVHPGVTSKAVACWSDMQSYHGPHELLGSRREVTMHDTVGRQVAQEKGQRMLTCG